MCRWGNIWKSNLYHLSLWNYKLNQQWDITMHLLGWLS